MTESLHESITVEPEMLHLGEKATIRVESSREYLPLTLEVTERYLEQEFTVGDGIRVNWEGTCPTNKGIAEFEPPAAGNYRVRIGDLTRHCGVLSPESTICTVTMQFASGEYPVGNQLDYYHPEIHSRPIPVDFAVHLTDERSLAPDWAVHRNLLGFQKVYGDDVFPVLNHSWFGNSRNEYKPRSTNPAHAALAGDLGSVYESWGQLGYRMPAFIDFGTIETSKASPVPMECDIISGHGAISLLDTSGNSISSADGSLVSQFVGARSGRNLLYNRSFGHPIDSDNTVHPRALAAKTETTAEALEATKNSIVSQLDTEAQPGLPFLSLIIDGDDFDAVALNRDVLNWIGDLPRRESLIFGRKQAIALYAAAHSYETKKA